MKRFYLLLLLCCLTIAANAQNAANYVLARTSGTYSSITGLTGTTSTTSISGDDYNLSGIPIGFTFTYCGVARTQLSACSNGWLSLNNSTSTAYYNDGGMASYAPDAGLACLFAYWDDLNGSGHTAYYQTTGTAPNRIFTFQWGDPGSQWGNYSGGGSATWQVKLYESSGVIQYIYGSGTYGSSATIGIANSSTDLLNLSNQLSTTGITTFSTGVTGSPAANTILTWTPPATLLRSPASMTFTTAVSTNSTAQTVTYNGYGYTSSPVTITAPANFQISSDGVTWVSSYTVATLTAALGTYIPSSTVQVRFNGPATTGTTTGNLTFTGAGITSTTVALTGNATNPCTGTPVAGTSSVSPAVGSASTPFTLTVSGYSIAGGIAFQWQSSSDATTWSNITGATNDTYNFTGITASKYYRCNVTCTNSSITSTSTQCQAVYLVASSCTPQYYYYTIFGSSYAATSDRLDNFSLTGVSSNINDNGPASHPANGYEDRTTVPAVAMAAGSTYSGTVTYAPTYYYYQSQIWIDYNDNGSFETSENVSGVFGDPASYIGSSSFSVSVPVTATVGLHRMRIRTAMTYSTSLSTAMDPCNYYDPSYFNYYYYGTTRDYVANILPPPPAIAATPASLAFGAVTTSTSSPAQTTNIVGTYLIPASGTYTVTAPSNFQVSSNGTTWLSTYTTSYSASGFVSTPVYVRLNPTAAISYTGNVTVVGGGATVNVPVSGNGAVACAGTPTAGTSSVLPTVSTPTTTTTLTASGYSTTGGINFQWQSSPNGTTWTNITGATNATYTMAGVSSTTYYRCNITCSISGITTNGASCVCTVLAPSSCTPSFYYSPSTGDRLDNFAMSGYSGSTISDNGPSIHPANGYEDRTIAVPAINLMQGTNYTGSVTYNPAYYYYETQIWIDFNDNGTFETSEAITNPFGDMGTYSSGVSYTVSIPILGALGAHRMRVRTAMTYNTSFSNPMDPCNYADASYYNYYYYGTTRDYVANIVPLPACSGTPTAGTVTSSTSTGCATISSNLGVTGASSGFSGLNYQWQSSPDNSTWTNISGATGFTYAATTTASTYYRSTLTCVNSSITSNTAGVQLVVNPIPTVSGTASMCVSSTTTLTPSIAGGTWSSSNTTLATVSTAGVVTSLTSAGYPNITYTLPTGCIRVTTVSINALPSAITVTPSTTASYCLGTGLTFTASASSPATAPPNTILSQDWNSGLGAWAINNISGTSSTYFAVRNSPGYGSVVTGDGTPYMEASPDALNGVTNTNFVSPSFSLVGAASASLSYNQYFQNYSGDMTVAVEYSINGGTTWSTLVNQLGSGVFASTFSASSPQVTVTMPAAALGQSNVKLRWNYISNYGYYWAIDNIKVTTPTPPTFTWTPVGAATGLSCTACATTTITPTATGANVYSITATTNGCSTTNTVTVNTPIPAAITGNLQVCAGLTTTLASVGGITWSSGNTTVATIGATTGIVTGVVAGTARVTYTITSTGCIGTAVVTVNPLPQPITGTTAVCVNATTTLADAATGGTWSSGSTGTGTVNATSGVVAGISAGLTPITLSLIHI